MTDGHLIGLQVAQMQFGVLQMQFDCNSDVVWCFASCIDFVDVLLYTTIHDFAKLEVRTSFGCDSVRYTSVKKVYVFDCNSDVVWCIVEYVQNRSFKLRRRGCVTQYFYINYFVNTLTDGAAVIYSNSFNIDFIISLNNPIVNENFLNKEI